MNIDWRRLSLSFIASLLFTTCSGVILSFILFPVNPWQEILQELRASQGKTAITFAQAGTLYFDPYFLPLWVIITGAAFFFLFFTLVFYATFRFYDRRKKSSAPPYE
jgi:hypothetical protein